MAGLKETAAGLHPPSWPCKNVGPMLSDLLVYETAVRMFVGDIS